MYRIPIYKISLVRDGSHQSDIRTIKQPSDVTELAKSYLQGVDREHFIILMLDTKNKLIGINTVSIGSLNSAIVHPREDFKPAILANANSIILAHNHPSGNPKPSLEDIKITERLIEGGKILGMEILDHIIIGEEGYNGYYSMKEHANIILVCIFYRWQDNKQSASHKGYKLK